MPVAPPDPVVAFMLQDVVVLVTGHRHSADELAAFLRDYQGKALASAPREWDTDKTAEAFEEHFHTYATVDYTEDLPHPLLVIARREAPRVGAGPR